MGSSPIEVVDVSFFPFFFEKSSLCYILLWFYIAYSVVAEHEFRFFSFLTASTCFLRPNFHIVSAYVVASCWVLSVRQQLLLLLWTVLRRDLDVVVRESQHASQIDLYRQAKSQCYKVALRWMS